MVDEGWRDVSLQGKRLGGTSSQLQCPQLTNWQVDISRILYTNRSGRIYIKSRSVEVPPSAPFSTTSLLPQKLFPYPSPMPPERGDARWVLQLGKVPMLQGCWRPWLHTFSFGDPILNILDGRVSWFYFRGSKPWSNCIAFKVNNTCLQTWLKASFEKSASNVRRQLFGGTFKQCSEFRVHHWWTRYCLYQCCLWTLPPFHPGMLYHQEIFNLKEKKMHSMICFFGEQQTAVQFHHPHLDAAPKPLDDWQIPILPNPYTGGLLLDELHLFCNWSIGLLHKFHLHFLPCNHGAGVTRSQKKTEQQSHPSTDSHLDIRFKMVDHLAMVTLIYSWKCPRTSTLQRSDHQFCISSYQTAESMGLLCLDFIVEVRSQKQYLISIYIYIHINTHSMGTNDTIWISI